jgi:methionyl-tRNA synthetase
LIIHLVSPIFGHAYEKICADAIARWHKLLGEDVFFLTGTDEHGSKIQKKATEAGKKPEDYVDDMVVFFKNLCEKLEIDYSRFIRTTEKDHEANAKKIFDILNDNGDIYLGKYTGWYCPECETFYTEKDLGDGCCPIHEKKAEWISEESYFFKMSNYTKKVLDYLEQNPNSVLPAGRKKEIINRVKEGLNDLSVSRVNVKWGIPVPINPMHSMYVWTDALVNYISGVAVISSTKNLGNVWPPNIHLIGKDILWHHTAIWYSILLAAGFELPKTVFAHGFINTESGDKMSKSKGTVIDPIEIAEKFGADSLRYFLLREIPFGQDGDFSEAALKTRNNNELANELGNLVNRTIVMIEKYCNGKIPKVKTSAELEKALNLKKIEEHMEKLELHAALSEIFAFIASCNKFINDKAPWKLKGKELEEVLFSLADSIRIISILVSPFMPSASEKINEQLGVKSGLLKDCKFNLLKAGTTIKKSEILFKKIE